MSDKTQRDDFQEYLSLRNATDPIEAFNIFIKRNLPDLYAHFIDSDDNEAEFVRRSIVARDERIKREAIHQKVIHVVESNHSDPNGIAEELLYDYKALTQSSQQSEHFCTGGEWSNEYHTFVCPETGKPHKQSDKKEEQPPKQESN